MRYVTAIYAPKDKQLEAKNLITELRTPSSEDLQRIHINGRWRCEHSFSVYAFYSWWNPIKKFPGYTTLCADRQLKILYFDGVSSSLDINGFKALTDTSKLSLLAKATLWAGVDQYFSQKEVLYPVRCYVKGAQLDPMEVNSILGQVETVRIPDGNLYTFYVTDYKDLTPLARAGIQCLINIGADEFVYSDSGLLRIQLKGDVGDNVEFLSKYLNIT